MGLAVYELANPSFLGGPLAGWRAEHPRITAFGRTWPYEHTHEYLDTLPDPPQICSRGACQHSQQEREPAVLASPAAALGRAVRGSPAGWLARQRSTDQPHWDSSLSLVTLPAASKTTAGSSNCGLLGCYQKPALRQLLRAEVSYSPA